MSLNVESLNVKIGGAQILKNVSLEIKDGEFVSLLGASGCGKSTLLKSVAGLLEVESGEISINQEFITKLLPEKRGTIIVFQDLRLFPHMTVEKNIAFAMELKRIPKEKQREKISELLESVQLSGFEKRKMREMSGGQMQRVALARALAAEPKVLLLDEPFSSLDEGLRMEMGQLVKDLHKRWKLTTVMVTHDKQEAMKLSDRIALMKEGEILQYDCPSELFHHPKERYVADYMGQANYICGMVSEGEFNSPVVKFSTEKEDGTYSFMIRPSDIQLANREDWKTGTVKEIAFLGEDVEIIADVEGIILRVKMLHEEWVGLNAREESMIGVFLKFKKGILFKGEN